MGTTGGAFGQWEWLSEIGQLLGLVMKIVHGQGV